MSGLLPAVAIAWLASVDPDAPALVSSRRSRTLHLQRGPVTLTAAGALRRGQRPLCKQRARRWYASSIDGRPLCRRCVRALAGVAPVVDGRAIAKLVPFAEVLATVETARTESDVSAAQILATNAGYLTRQVTDAETGRSLLFTRVIARARDRVTARRSHLTSADRAWGERRLPLASAFPRRVR